MNHPLLDKIWKVGLYLIFWVLFGYLYFYYISERHPIAGNYIILESLITVLFQFSINIGLWYFLKYNQIEEQNSLNLVKNIVIAGLIIDFFWIFGIYSLVLLFLGENTAYSDYFWLSIWNKTLLGTAIYFFVLLLYYLILYYEKFRENVVRKNQLALKLQEQELANLKSQINPHFLFNSLNSISNLVYEDTENAHEAIVKLSDYFRYSLSTSKQQFISLEQELENTHRYLDIEKIRFDDKMQINFRVDENAKKWPVPLLILQPIIENAIKHGVYESTELVRITIEVKNFSDYLKISITNNFDKEAKTRKGEGVGLENVRQRLALLYKRDDLLNIKKENDIFEVKIFIPGNDEIPMI